MLNTANVGVITTGVMPAACAILIIASTSSGPLAGSWSERATSFTPALIVTTAGWLSTTSRWKRARICEAFSPGTPRPIQRMSIPFAASPWTVRFT